AQRAPARERAGAATSGGGENGSWSRRVPVDDGVTQFRRGVPPVGLEPTLAAYLALTGYKSAALPIELRGRDPDLRSRRYSMVDGPSSEHALSVSHAARGGYRAKARSSSRPWHRLYLLPLPHRHGWWSRSPDNSACPRNWCACCSGSISCAGTLTSPGVAAGMPRLSTRVIASDTPMKCRINWSSRTGRRTLSTVAPL